MNKWLLLTLILAILMAGQSLRADDTHACREGHAVFGKLVCRGTSSSEAILDAYFYGATTLREIQANFPERISKLAEQCETKMRKRQLARAPTGTPIEGLEFKVFPVEACLGKRGYQQPCVKDDDCLEHICHPERGTCSTVFTVPLSNY
jgi:hypothetical protein